MRLTKHRTEILTTLTSSPESLSASAVHARLPHIDLVTIYRNLDRFVSAGLIKKLHLAGNEATYEHQHHPHQHAVCDTCDKVIHFTIPTDVLIQQFTLPHFTIKSIDVVVHGSCDHP